MSKNTVSQIRSTFVDYFVNNAHTHVESSSLIPHNDPSLMFVNSGMVQFKNVFTGIEEREYVRAVSSQKCVRAGGKHNDLDNVGYTARHHTFFEMLGNFSFGDYFKEQAIYYSWELLTKKFCIDKNRLYVTVYHTDDEAADYWKKIAGLTDDRIIRISTNDNFWSMGDTGPCGPCSEIFYDHGDKIYGGLPGTSDQDGDRYVEIWNMVFMQYEQVSKDQRIELPKRSIDTGAGLERLASVLQGKNSNFEIDLFMDITCEIEQMIGVKATGSAKSSYHVIADHLRSMAFLVADGIVPSNEGRGYVLRRIMRRAIRHAHQLGAKDSVMHKLLPKLVDLMGSSYPELKRAEDFICDILKNEEEKFKVTLDRGLNLLHQEIRNFKSGDILSGDIAFKLYDTYGFPLDLTEDILKNKEIGVDNNAFEAQMEQQKDRARKSWVGSGEESSNKIWFDLRAKFGVTEFLGYNANNTEAVVLMTIRHKDSMEIITNQTTFYGESGGQVGDVGYITSTNFRARVINTVKNLGMISHICLVESGDISDGDTVTLSIDTEYRNNIRKHHSATHILHAVLRNILGTHVVQRGSLVAHDRLRFDISYNKAITQSELYLIEDKVNDIIRCNSKISTHLMSYKDATEKGAMALFGEKYESEVRVVSMDSNYSIELCGGTHVRHTGDIGSFKILSESAVASGVRRIEAACGYFAELAARENEVLVRCMLDVTKSAKSDLLVKVEKMLQNQRRLEKELSSYKARQLDFSDNIINEKSMEFFGHRIFFHDFQGVDIKSLRSSAEALAKKHNDLATILIGNNDDKLSIIVSVSQDISHIISASRIARLASEYLGGSGGGGSNNLAQGGGVDVDKISSLIDYLKTQSADFSC